MSDDSNDDGDDGSGRRFGFVRDRITDTARTQAERVGDRSDGDDWRHSIGVALAVVALVCLSAAVVLVGVAIYARSTSYLLYAGGCLFAAFVLGRIGLYVDVEATAD